jgi:hypothetical protein
VGFNSSGLLEDRLGMRGFIPDARLLRWATGEDGIGKNIEEGFGIRLFVEGEYESTKQALFPIHVVDN